MPAMQPTITTATGARLGVSQVDPQRDGDRLHVAFNRILAAGEGYPQDGPVDRDEFARYWLDGKTLVVAAWGEPGRVLAGTYFLCPNGVGRAAHVANGGYFVVNEYRGQGVGKALVQHSMSVAPGLGFDALQFNFVFESNPARRLYERLGFLVVGRVPEVIDGEDVLIYWRRLDPRGTAVPRNSQVATSMSAGPGPRPCSRTGVVDPTVPIDPTGQAGS